jgi:hypothetical protein
MDWVSSVVAGMLVRRLRSTQTPTPSNKANTARAPTTLPAMMPGLVADVTEALLEVDWAAVRVVPVPTTVTVGLRTRCRYSETTAKDCSGRSDLWGLLSRTDTG